jgi:hypothetical protein
MKRAREECAMGFLALPIDAQASILAFLPHGDLARFSEISRGCRGVATMDHLWIPVLQPFKDVQAAPRFVGLSPCSLFRALVISSCSVCGQTLLPTKPRPESTLFQAPHSCKFEGCTLLCCAACRCQCHCLKFDYKYPKPEYVYTITCSRCHGWAHSRRCAQEELEGCTDCGLAFCSDCSALDVCNYCDELHCPECMIKNVQ